MLWPSNNVIDNDRSYLASCRQRRVEHMLREHAILEEMNIYTRSSMVHLDRASHSFLWICNGLAHLTDALTGDFDTRVPHSVGTRCHRRTLAVARVSLPNDISFRLAALAGCTSVTDGQTDRLRSGYVVAFAGKIVQ